MRDCQMLETYRNYIKAGSVTALGIPAYLSSASQHLRENKLNY